MTAASSINKNQIETPKLTSPNGELSIDSDLALGLGNEITGLSTNKSDANAALTVGAADSRYFSQDGDVLNGDIDMNGNNISNLNSISATGPLTLQNQLNLESSLDLGSNKITNLDSPSSSSDAATKNYVDSEISNSESQSTQNLTEVLNEGSQANQAIDMGTNNIVGLTTDTTNSNSALNVGAGDSRYLSRSGDTISGNLDMDSNRIQNLPTPSSSGDAAPKSYVDSKDHTDDQSLSIDSSNNNDEITLDNGGTVTIDDEYEANTDASTKCSGSNYLNGNGNCVSDSNTNTQLDDQAAEGTVDMAGYNVTSTNGEFCIGKHC